MEKRHPTIVERVLHRDDTARGVGEVACNGLQPTEIPDDVIVTRYTVTLYGQTSNFVELIPKSA